MRSRPTVAGLRALKGKRPILTMHMGSAQEAAAEAGIEMLTCEVDAILPGNHAAFTGAFLQAAHTQVTVYDKSSDIREGFCSLGMGVDTIYLSGS